MNIIAVTACITGIAETYIAADVLTRCARYHGHNIKVETQGVMGIMDPINKKDLSSADAAILTTDIPLHNANRFEHIPQYPFPIKDIIENPQAVMSTLSKCHNKLIHDHTLQN
ncbi:PTS system fructose-like EIIB component 3 [invertebrate metagenome]|uniref:PTS system fructose-like EIIB component 3 n=1 Tax=invertebrate metagenome TaxID=1711999 RepID=A0A2H9T7H6_9ZZZZ